MCGMTHSCVCHDSFISVTWLLHTCDMLHSHACHDAFVYVRRDSWLFHTCDMTHIRMRHDSFICVTWLLHMCDMPLRRTESCHISVSTRCMTWVMSHTTRSCGTWLILCGTWLIYVGHDSFSVSTRCMAHVTHKCRHHYDIMAHMSVDHISRRFHTCDVTHLYTWQDSFTCVTCRSGAMSHVAYKCVKKESCHTYEWVMAHRILYMCDMTLRRNASCHI